MTGADILALQDSDLTKVKTSVLLKTIRAIEGGRIEWNAVGRARAGVVLGQCYAEIDRRIPEAP